MSQLLRKQLEFGCHNNGQITKIKQKKIEIKINKLVWDKNRQIKIY